MDCIIKLIDTIKKKSFGRKPRITKTDFIFRNHTPYDLYFEVPQYRYELEKWTIIIRQPQTEEEQKVVCGNNETMTLHHEKTV
jgi:hypothetical protein